MEDFRNDITRIKCNPKNFNRIGYGNIRGFILFYAKSSKPIWNEPKEKYTTKNIEKLFPKSKLKEEDIRPFLFMRRVKPKTVNPVSHQRNHAAQGRHWRTEHSIKSG